ncbi:MAG: VWA domain-containing protein [Lentisphaeria bacterium]|nr:VWA domain-containing protein [Lentisphaeria bacterium]
MKAWINATLAIGIVLTGALAMGGGTSRKVTLKAELTTPVIHAGRRQTAFLKVGLTGFELLGRRDRAPVNIALVIDRSGSMSGEKIAKAREAAEMAVRRLDARDILSVISYASGTEVIVPATRLTDREDVIRRIRKIRSGGGTALFAGVSKGAAEVRKFLENGRVNRVILLSDGQANEGPSSPAALADLGRSLGRERMSVTTIGLGSGYNEDLMFDLAQASDGNHSFAKTAADLVAIFDREFSDVLSVVAQEVIVTIRCADGVRPVRVVGREAEIRGGEVRFLLNQIYSRQEKYAVIEVDLPATEAGKVFEVAKVEVSYANALTHREDRLASHVRARATTSAREVEKERNREASIAAVEQVANVANIQAMKLRDKGKVHEAQQVLSDNAAMVQGYNKDLKSDKLARVQKENREQVDQVKSSKWSFFRKKMRSSQYESKNQQSRGKK